MNSGPFLVFYSLSKFSNRKRQINDTDSNAFKLCSKTLGYLLIYSYSLRFIDSESIKNYVYLEKIYINSGGSVT
jgi:hypothetical protein